LREPFQLHSAWKWGEKGKLTIAYNLGHYVVPLQLYCLQGGFDQCTEILNCEYSTID